MHFLVIKEIQVVILEKPANRELKHKQDPSHLNEQRNIQE